LKNEAGVDHSEKASGICSDAVFLTGNGDELHDGVIRVKDNG